MFTWGVKELDNLLGRALKPGTVVVVAGNPGSGKTTLASTLCYANALRGHPCVYLTLQEPEDKYLSQMRNFGMDFEALRGKGLFKFVRVPTQTSGDIEGLMNLLNEQLTGTKARVVVVDSFTPISKLVKDLAARAVLQNYFYNMALIIGGVVVIIGEIPIGMEATMLGDIEFVADVVLILKHKLTRGRLSRYMEIRKARGAPLTLAEIPFTMVDGRGIQLYVPPLLHEIKPVTRRRSIRTHLKSLEFLEPIYLGSYAIVAVPPDLKLDQLILLLILQVFMLNKLRALVLNFGASPEEFRESARLTCLRAEDDQGGAIHKYLSEDVVVESVNPLTQSIEELLSREMSLIEEHKPDALVLNRTDLSYLIHGTEDPEKYFSLIRNLLLYQRAKGILVVDVFSVVDERLYSHKASIADVVFRVFHRIEGDKPRIYLWASARDKPPAILDAETISDEVYRRFNLRLRM